MTVPARRPEDDALDRLDYASREMPHAPIGRFAADVLAVREALERLRSVKAIAQIKELLERAESAEAERDRMRHWAGRAEVAEGKLEAAQVEKRRLTEGLRDLIKEAPEALDQNAVWVDDLLDLLSASPSDGGEPWESFASSQGGIFNGPHPADEEPDGGGA